MHAKWLQSCPTLCDPKDYSPPVSSWRFSRQEYWNGLPSPPPVDLPDPEIKPKSPVFPSLQADSLLLSHWGSPTSHVSMRLKQWAERWKLESKYLLAAVRKKKWKMQLFSTFRIAPEAGLFLKLNLINQVFVWKFFPYRIIGPKDSFLMRNLVKCRGQCCRSESLQISQAPRWYLCSWFMGHTFSKAGEYGTWVYFLSYLFI